MMIVRDRQSTHLEPLVLQDLLDGDVTISWIVQQSRLEDDTKGTVSDDFAVGIGDLPLVAGLAIRGDDLDDLARIIDSYWCEGVSRGH